MLKFKLMFKSNSQFQEGCNYSFQEDNEEKENIFMKGNRGGTVDGLANL